MRFQPKHLSDERCSPAAHSSDVNVQLIDEHRLVFKLNNEVIRSFPVTTGMTLSGIIKLLPPEALLLIVSLLIALIMVAFTRTWVRATPDAQDFADPDAVLT